MKKQFLFILTLCLGLCFDLSAASKTQLLNSKTLTLAFTASDGWRVSVQYFGKQISEAEAQQLVDMKQGYGQNAYPAFGLSTGGDYALQVVLPDGSMALDLSLTETNRTTGQDGETLTFTYRDKVYPLIVRQHYKAYKNTDIISTWTELENKGKGEVVLQNFASVCMPVERGDNYLTQFHGTWAAESYMQEEKLPIGKSVIEANDDMRNAFDSQAGFMISVDGKPQENSGTVFGGNLAYTGDYKTRICVSPSGINVFSGINPNHATYYLKAGEKFTLPEFLMTISQEGKGGVSRNFHRWAMLYGLHGADTQRDILLNSWEGVYFGVNEPVMSQMMQDIKSLGGELFVMDDGWFGEKYPRLTDNCALGDWKVDRNKLPNGVPGLVKEAKRVGVKFGIWIEPEMTNTKSELYDKHPDWVLQQQNRPLRQGRGGTQVILDMCNPKVQDYVFSIVDDLMRENPDIAYIKWDCNASMMNYGSLYLPKNRQSELAIRYNQGLAKVCERIRAKYPKLVIQDCASGGGRVNYGMLKWFDEFWTSDDTDAKQRVFIQWGDSHFYPARAMASHVSASPNHQTGRLVPLKFRFDVAMSARLGMELQPSKMTEEERAFSKRSIAAYKSIRPLVQNGDLYRLQSPYNDSPVSALMYSNEDKSRCVLFAYRLDYLMNQQVPKIRLAGVDENKNYMLRDLTPKDEKKPSDLDGKVISGKVLRNFGLNLAHVLGRVDTSLCLELVAQ